MSRMLHLVRDGWSTVQILTESGQYQRALATLQHLLANLDLPVTILVSARRLAAELELKLEQYATARRHLKAALTVNRNDPDLIQLLCQALENDPEVSDERAWRWYRRGLRLGIHSAEFLARAGRLAVRVGHRRSGLQLLRRAAKNIESEQVLCLVVEGFQELGRCREAQRIITLARFGSMSVSLLNSLEQRLRFEEARLKQKLMMSDRVRRPLHLRVMGRQIRKDLFSSRGPRLRLLDRG